MQKKIVVLGAGSWGTALAIHLARHNPSVTLWGRNADKMQAMQTAGCNTYYLPETPFPSNLSLAQSLEEALENAHSIVFATPSHAVSPLLSDIKNIMPSLPKAVLMASKGWMVDAQDEPIYWQDLIQATFEDATSVSIISGPSFAKELAAGLPTAMVIANSKTRQLHYWVTCFHHDNLRIYQGTDVQGVQIGSTLKNPFAVAAGIVDGLNLGANAHAALVTRSFAEMMRLGGRLGARIETFTGLAGIGDLMLTANSDLSRNRRLGLALGRGMSLAEAQKTIGQVVESVGNIQSILTIAAHHGIPMPIIGAIHKVLSGKCTPHEAMQRLLKRASTEEHLKK